MKLKDLLLENPDGTDPITGEPKQGDACPMCATDHMDPNTQCDYEECGHCGMDHTYEPQQAYEWHQGNDPENSLYDMATARTSPSGRQFESVEPGDLVDTVGDEYGDFAGVRVLELVDDVTQATGVGHDPNDVHSNRFKGPGFVGQTPEGDEVVFAMSQIVPGSSDKYVLPVLPDDVDNEDPAYSDYYGDDGSNASVPFRARPFGEGAVVRGVLSEAKGYSFDKFVDDILVKESRQPKVRTVADSSQREVARKAQERPLGRIRFGGKR